MEAGKNILTFTNNIGGLTTLLPTLTALFTISNFSKIAKEIKGIGTTFNSIIGIIKLLKTTSKETGMSMLSVFTQVAGAANLTKIAIGGIGAALTIGLAIWQAYKNKIEETRKAALDEADTHLTTISNKEEEIGKEEENIETIREEIKQLDKYSTTEDGTEAKIQNKKDEIEQRQKNIQAMKDERKEEAKKAYTNLVGQEPNKTAGTIITQSEESLPGAAGWINVFKAGGNAARSNTEFIKKYNEAVKDVTNNTGEYKRKAEEVINAASEQRSKLDENSEEYKQLTEDIQTMNKQLNKQADQYEQDKKQADTYYEALLNGTDQVSASEAEWLQNFEGYSNDQMEQLRNGIDIRSEQAESINKVDEAKNQYLTTLREEESETASLNKQLDEMQEGMNTLKNAVDEYNSNGYISLDTLQSLLSLNSDYLSLLEMQDGQLILNTESIDNMANALVNQKQEELQAAAIADIWAIAQEGAAKSSDTAADAAENAGETAGASGDDAAKGINGWLQYAAAVDSAAEAAGKTVDDEETKKRIQERVEQYKEAAKTISQLGSSFGSGGYSTDTTHKYKGSGSKSKGSSSKSTKEEYKATIDTLYNYTNALEIAKDAVDKLQDALKNTDNYEEQEKYINQLISALNDEINKTNDLKDAQTRQINDYINQLKAQGFAIDYNSSKNTLYINNMQHLADFSGDTAKSLEKMIDKIQDLNKDNIKLDSSVRDLTKDTKDYNEQLEKLPTEKLKKFKELLEDFQQGRLDQIQNQIDDIQHEMENDPRIKALEKQISALEEQNDALDKQKDIEEKILAVEEAKEKLANAQKQRNIQLYTDSGWQWVADPDTIKENAEELRDAQEDLNDQIKQDQIDQLNDEKDALEKSYQDRIDALQDFLDEQNYQIDKANREGIETFKQLQDEMAKYGLNNAEYLSQATTWLNNYNTALANLDTTVEGILSKSTIAQDGLIYSSATQDRINQALSNTLPVISTATGLQLNQVDYDALKENGGSGDIYINSIELPNVKDVDDFIKALKDLPRLATSKSTQRT